MGKFWSGLGTLKAQRSPLLHCSRQSHRLLPPTINLLRAHHHPRHHTYLKLNVGSSPSCSATWSIPPSFLRSSTQKSIGTWYGRISRCVRKLFSAMRDTSPSFLGMVFLSISAIPTPMKMTPKEQ